MLIIICVKSSSLRCCESCFTDGLTAGGGTAKTWHIIHSGLDHIGPNPINETSSSDILFKHFNRISGVSVIVSLSLSPSSFRDVSFSHSATSLENPSFLIRNGCLHPQPSSVSSPQRFIAEATAYTASHRLLSGNAVKWLYLRLHMRSLLHLIHTVRIISWMLLRY